MSWSTSRGTSASRSWLTVLDTVAGLIMHTVHPDRRQKIYAARLHGHEEFLGVVLDWR